MTRKQEEKEEEEDGEEEEKEEKGDIVEWTKRILEDFLEMQENEMKNFSNLTSGLDARGAPTSRSEARR